jgi:outer membrane protein OmpA-like peptidoglycan-associated protein/uncharacterized protein YidB (DUF937 family)
MFEQLVNETASQFNVSTSSVATLNRGVLSMMTNERTGGTEGFMDLFRRAGLGDILSSWFGGREGRALTPSNVETALGTNTVDSMARSSGLTRTVATSALAFLVPKIISRLTPSGVFPSRSSLLSQVATDIERPAVTTVERVAEPRTGVRWLPWAAAAILGLLAWLWMRGPAGTIDPQLTVANRAGHVTYSGVVRDEATRTGIANSLRSTFGAGNVQGDVRVDKNVKASSWLKNPGELFGALKTPGAEVSIKGNEINVGGWLSPAERQATTEKIRAVAGSGANITAAGDAAAEAVRAANNKAMAALGALGTTGATVESVVAAINQGIINFPSGSAQIPADNLELVRRSAQAIQSLPATSRIEIGGHTDNVGDPASNMALSQQRADAVRDALVASGVPAGMLVARGYGDTQPRASNDSEQGRFQNRRIEYSVAR